MQAYNTQRCTIPYQSPTLGTRRSVSGLGVKTEVVNKKSPGTRPDG